MLEPQGVTIPHWIVTRTDISAGAKILYGVLLRGSGGRLPAPAIEPSIVRLCLEAGLSPRLIRKHLRELELNGFIKLRLTDVDADVAFETRGNFE